MRGVRISPKKILRVKGTLEVATESWSIMSCLKQAYNCSEKNNQTSGVTSKGLSVRQRYGQKPERVSYNCVF
jgi:hypothetical protein